MEKKILIFILLLIGNGIVKAVEYPFVPSYNEHFIVEDYGNEVVGSAERPFSGKLLEDWEDYVRMNPTILWYENYDSDWPSYVDADYWKEFLDKYPKYYNEVKEYFDDPNHSNYPNNPFRVSLLDDAAGILVLLIGGIAYLIYKFKFKKNETFKN